MKESLLYPAAAPAAQEKDFGREGTMAAARTYGCLANCNIVLIMFSHSARHDAEQTLMEAAWLHSHRI